MQEINIRHSDKKDIEAIHKIYSDTNAYSGTLQLPYPSLTLWESRLENLPQGIYSLIAEIDNEIIGQIGLHVEQSPRRKHVATFGMGVRDKYQGKGVGSKLLSSVIDLAENWLNIQRIELTVYTDNDPAIALYKKYGFIMEGESAKFAFRNGQYVSVYHMARVK
ncbi:GNAT family N-acetyltransferase [Sansalvadorimonas sp. 2012CJ34-2]|uniref:GNAT family N-acetyltransferase n=1 Tax=Parendozoicomonas callyspongiae TaxID=2942213 RepID=A0ABT0PNM7_9GAMM|nr:GNAT family N-acetyltransferase [Sansalvadorimonas sp. 2012CJ34-2]